jgi:hypothetical protein
VAARFPGARQYRPGGWRRDSDVTFACPLDHGGQVCGVLNELGFQQGGIPGGGDVPRPRERAVERPAGVLVLSPVQTTVIGHSPGQEVQDDLVMGGEVTEDPGQPGSRPDLPVVRVPRQRPGQAGRHAPPEAEQGQDAADRDRLTEVRADQLALQAGVEPRERGAGLGASQHAQFDYGPLPDGGIDVAEQARKGRTSPAAAERPEDLNRR